MSTKLNPKYKWKELDKRVFDTLSTQHHGYDYNHIQRVLKNSENIANAISKDTIVDYDNLAAACYVHDISFKSLKKHHIESADKANMILPKMGFLPEDVEKIHEIILNHNRAYQPDKLTPIEDLSIEAKILCDADRLDALGSVGIVRQIRYCISQGIPTFRSKKDKRSQSVYGRVKYLITLAKDMILPEAQVMAKERLPVMRKFIKQLEKEFQ